MKNTNRSHRPLGSALCAALKPFIITASALATIITSYGTVGATVPFTSYEGESGSLGGGATAVTLAIPYTQTISSPQLEASGHAFAKLSGTSQSVTFTNSTGQNITALNIRYSVPDASAGGGADYTLSLYVNGTFTQSIPMTSRQSWVYETSSSSVSVQL